MNRLSTLVLIGLAGVLTGCGSSVTSSTQPPTHVTYSMNVTPDRVVVNEGDFSTISAIVDESTLNSTPRPVSPPPVVKFYSSDPRVTISPSGQVCGGQWDGLYQRCNPTASLPPNPVIITAYDNVHNVSGSTQVFTHLRAATISLVAPTYPSAYPQCVSQNASIPYVAHAFDSTGTLIPNCADSNVAGCINNLDYTWATNDSTVASAGEYGGVVARNPGVTSVTAKLNGTTSTPAAFATCPPAGIVLASSAYTKGTPVPPYSTADLDTLSSGSTQYLTAQSVDDLGNPMALVDLNGNPLNTLSLDFLSSDLLTGGFVSVDAVTSRFTATTPGRTILSTSCTPPTCNPSISDFVLPSDQTTVVTAKSLGYGYPIYSNVIGASVTGATGSTVLVTGTAFVDGTASHLLLTYDSESLLQTHQIEIANPPNSLVVAPNGVRAYLGSDDGLVVVDLSSYQSAIHTYPIIGDPVITDVITGKVIAVSPDSRYVIISDTNPASTNYQVVFLIDTTGTKAATRYAMKDNIRAAAFAVDGYDFWIGGDSGVYVYQADTFVKTATNVSSKVTAMVWASDGQSYFASGNSSLDNYSTCDDGIPPPHTPPLPLRVQSFAANPVNLTSTAINGETRVFGFSGSSWLDFSVGGSSQPGKPKPIGNVCLSTVTVTGPATAPSTIQCTAQQFSFSPRLEQEFITGVNSTCGTPESVIHGYDLSSKLELTLTASTPIVPLSGGILNDGRELYVGTWDATAKTAELHRFNLLTNSGSAGTLAEDFAPVSVPLVPSFVAVVPK